MKDGQEVWLAFATERASDGQPVAFVTRGVMLDGENMVVKREGGSVGVIGPHSSETVHYTEVAAWRACADRLLLAAQRIEDEAARCIRQSGSAIVKLEAETV